MKALEKREAKKITRPEHEQAKRPHSHYIHLSRETSRNGESSQLAVFTTVCQEKIGFQIFYGISLGKDLRDVGELEKIFVGK